MEQVMEKLRKILELSKSGIAGEAENARRQLAMLCKKYGIDPEALTDDVKRGREIPYKGADERKIIAQICFVFGGVNEVRFNDERIYIEATDLQYANIEAALSVTTSSEAAARPMPTN